MIHLFLKAYPILKKALLYNMKNKLGPKLFVPIITGLEQPTLEGLVANISPKTMAAEVCKSFSSKRERERGTRLVAENPAWFHEFKALMMRYVEKGYGRGMSRIRPAKPKKKRAKKAHARPRPR